MSVCVYGQSHQSKQRKMDKQWQSKHCGRQGEKGTDREEQAETDGEKGMQVGGDSEVTGLTGEIKSRRDRHRERERYGGGLGDSQEAMS